MLIRVRIEVEEKTVEEVVEALSKYEHAIQCAEAQRYQDNFPAQWVKEEGDEEPRRVGPCLVSDWNMNLKNRDWWDFDLGREITEEVIEFDEGLPGYRGRRVVRYKRVDTRSDFQPVGTVAGTVASGGLTFSPQKGSFQGYKMFDGVKQVP